MNKHVEKAMEIRNETPMVNNCAQTILRAYANELGITGDMAAKLSANFGGGMKCGSICGAITGGLMVLGALGVENPYVINQFRRRIADNHNGMTDCADLLKANAEKGGVKKVHCDGMIREAIELIDELVKQEQIQKGWIRMEFSDVIKNRYSCKKFSDKEVKKEALDKILGAGRIAPTAKNLQEQHIYVVQSENGLAAIDKVTPCRYNAPVVLVVAYNKNNVFTYPGGKRDSGIEDASIVATHMMLAAYNEGVDSCWINFFDPDELATDLGLPEEEEILMLLDLGIAAEGTGALPNHSSRKDLEETVTYM